MRSEPTQKAALISASVDIKSRLTSGFSLALLANFLWGASFLASKYTLAAWGPITASSLRFILATICLYLGLMILGKKVQLPKGKEWVGLLAISTTGFGLLYPLQLFGLKNISSGFSAAIMLTSPLIVIVLGRIALKESVSLQKWFSLGLGVIGGSILLSIKQTSSTLTLSANFMTGAIATLLASALLAASVILTRKMSKGLPSHSITFWTMAIGCLQLTAAALIFESESFLNCIETGTLMSWFALLFLAVVCSAFCFFIWNASLAKSSPQEIASSMHIKTPTAVILGALIAQESISLQLVLGTTIVMLGIWLSQQKNFWSTK